MLRLCAERGCNRAVAYRGRCREHAAQDEHRHEAKRVDATFYQRKRWRMTRKRQLFNEPLCELGHPGCTGIADEVHHRVPLEEGGEAYEFANLISTCKPCHTREHGHMRRAVAASGVRGVHPPNQARGVTTEHGEAHTPRGDGRICVRTVLLHRPGTRWKEDRNTWHALSADAAR